MHLFTPHGEVELECILQSQWLGRGVLRPRLEARQNTITHTRGSEPFPANKHDYWLFTVRYHLPFPESTDQSYTSSCRSAASIRTWRDRNVSRSSCVSASVFLCPYYPGYTLSSEKSIYLSSHVVLYIWSHVISMFPLGTPAAGEGRCVWEVCVFMWWCYLFDGHQRLRILYVD